MQTFAVKALAMPRRQSAITLIAPAKLTTELRVVGVRGDGYHLIDAEMVSLSLCDTLLIEELDAGDGPDGSDGPNAPDGPDAPGGDQPTTEGSGRLGSGADRVRASSTITIGGPFGDGVPSDSNNLVAKALRMVGRAAAVRVDKQIPPGGGLGGGSADAAAVLRWAGFNDLEAASRLGADIPFCMVGGRARVTGIGEIVEPLPAKPTTFTLVVPPFGVSTPLVYRAWDELDGPRGDNGNDLEPAALIVEPRLRTWKDLITEHAGAAPRLAGSGATWFLEGRYDSLIDDLPGALVMVVRT